MLKMNKPIEIEMILVEMPAIEIIFESPETKRVAILPRNPASPMRINTFANSSIVFLVSFIVYFSAQTYKKVSESKIALLLMARKNL